MSTRGYAPTDALLRHADRLTGRVVLFGAAVDAALVDPRDVPATWVGAVLWDHGVTADLAPAGVDVVQGVWCPPDWQADVAVLFVPGARERLHLLAAAARQALGADSLLVTVGEKSQGGGSVARHLAPYFGQVERWEGARHCLLHAARPDAPAPAPTTFLRDLPISRQNWEATDTPSANTLTLRAYPGIFASGRVDAGTRMLLQSFDTHPLEVDAASTVVDMGCGSGVLSVVIAQRAGAKVIAIDRDAVAVWSARASAVHLGLTTIDVRGADAWAGYAVGRDGRADLVVSNPPFHHAGHSDHATPRRMIEGAARVLKPGGRLRLVANRFLPYPDVLQQTYGSFRVLAEDGKFRVYEAVWSGAP